MSIITSALESIKLGTNPAKIPNHVEENPYSVGPLVPSAMHAIA